MINKFRLRVYWIILYCAEPDLCVDVIWGKTTAQTDS